MSNSSPATAAVTAPPAGATVAAGWDTCAEKYDAEAHYITAPPAFYALRKALDLHSSDAAKKLVLADLACGPGVVALEAATQHSDRFESILASDFSQGMCALLQRKAAALQTEQPTMAPIRTLVADATNLAAISGSSVDLCVCAFGLMMIPNAETAVREMVRITKPGGLIVVTTWLTGASQFHGFLTRLDKHLAQRATSASGAPTTVAAPAAVTKLFPFNTLESLEEVFVKAGGTEKVVLEGHLHQTCVYEDAETFWRSRLGITPVWAKHGDPEQQVAWVREYLDSIWGETAPFTLTLQSCIAIMRKK